MRTLAVGAHALFALVDDPRQAMEVRRMVLGLAADEAPDLATPVDVVPAARTVLIDGLPGPASVAAWRSRLGDVEAVSPEVPRVESGPDGPVTLDVRYDGSDLDVVARAWGCSRDEVVGRHAETEFQVAFCGFAPGFAYCVTSAALPRVPRRDEPRPRVPAGAVALAGEYCGIYPRAMPGGWQLIGTTSAVLFDATREPPALLSPGRTVRFRRSG